MSDVEGDDAVAAPVVAAASGPMDINAAIQVSAIPLTANCWIDSAGLEWGGKTVTLCRRNLKCKHQLLQVGT